MIVQIFFAELTYCNVVEVETPPVCMVEHDLTIYDLTACGLLEQLPLPQPSHLFFSVVFIPRCNATVHQRLAVKVHKVSVSVNGSLPSAFRHPKVKYFLCFNGIFWFEFEF